MFVFLNVQNDVGRSVATSHKLVSDTAPYQSPDSPRITDNRRHLQQSDLLTPNAQVASSAASDSNTQM